MVKIREERMIDLKKLGKYILEHYKVLVFTGLIMMMVGGSYVMIVISGTLPVGGDNTRKLIVELLKHQIIGAAFGAILATFYLTAKFCFLQIGEKVKAKKRQKKESKE